MLDYYTFICFLAHYVFTNFKVSSKTKCQVISLILYFRITSANLLNLVMLMHAASTLLNSVNLLNFEE